MKTFAIAEIGINHNGSIDVAKQLIDLAVRLGCGAVKFQKRTIDEVYFPNVLKKSFNSPWGTTFGDFKRRLEFSAAEYEEINRYCELKGIEWFASAWDFSSQEFLRRFNLKHNKISSAMAKNFEFVRFVAEEKRPTFVSTGLSSMGDVGKIVAIFEKASCPLTLMHCVSMYPCPPERLNLLRIQKLNKNFSVPVGYSGHEVSPMPSIIAASLGAVAIERHITMDRTMFGPDHAASLEPRGLEIMMKGLATLDVSLGTGESEVLQEDIDRFKNRYKVLKSIQK